MDLADIRKKAGMSTTSERTALPVENTASASQDAVDDIPVFEPFTTGFMDSLMSEEILGQPLDVFPSEMEIEAETVDVQTVPYDFSAVAVTDGREEMPFPEPEFLTAIPDVPLMAATEPVTAEVLSAENEDFQDTGGRSPLEILMAGRALLQEEETYGETEAGMDYAGESLLEYLCFRVSDELYAVSIMEIKEIIKIREWTEVPRAPHFIRGVISLRGVIIPVFDMRRRLGLPAASASGKERIVVIKEQEGFCGILVDEVVQVVRIPVTSIEPAPSVLEGIDRDFVLGIGRHENNMLILLSLENILNLELV